jgi:hypothetical protein
MKKERSGAKKELSGVKKELSGMKKEPSGVKKEPSGMKKELSGVKKEPSGMKKEPSGMKKEPSGAKKERSGATPEPSAATPEPSGGKKETPFPPPRRGTSSASSGGVPRHGDGQDRDGGGWWRPRSREEHPAGRLSAPGRDRDHRSNAVETPSDGACGRGDSRPQTGSRQVQQAGGFEVEAGQAFQLQGTAAQRHPPAHAQGRVEEELQRQQVVDRGRRSPALEKWQPMCVCLAIRGVLCFDR